MEQEIHFHSLEPLIEEKRPNPLFLKEVFEQSEARFPIGDTFYDVYLEKCDDSYFWIYLNYGNTSPRTDEIPDISTGAKINNPRKDSQIEPNKQIFSVYNKESNILYISNLQKKNAIKELFQSKTDQEIILKNLYKNIEDFLEDLKSLDHISFVRREVDILNAEHDINKFFPNTLGLDNPDTFKIEAKFDRKISSKLKEAVIQFKNNHRHCIKNIKIVGKSENGFEKIFNETMLVNKFTILAQKDHQGLFDSESVKVKTIQKLKTLL